MAFCDVCTAIQFHNILKAEGQPHHKSIRDLSVSANACGLCALLFSICQSTSLGDDIPIFLHGNRYVEGPKAIGDGIDRAGLLSVELCSRTQKSLEQDLGVKKFLDEEEVMGGQNRFGCHIGGVTLYAEKSIGESSLMLISLGLRKVTRYPSCDFRRHPWASSGSSRRCSPSARMA